MSQKYYQLKIKLEEMNTEVWRKFIVPAEIPLDMLHDAIQVIMGWKDSHLHEFNFGKDRFVEVIDEEFDDESTQLEGHCRLNKFFKKKGDKCLYVYDFGDSWAHTITLENSNYKLKDDQTDLFCLDGARACPPENIGGPPGYEDFCEAISKPKSEKAKQMLDWAFGSQPTEKNFDPEYFNKYAVNDMLQWLLRWGRPRPLL